jgi:UDP-N-acetylmuramoyl-tripeptide--D-alanyl-D-alanine ligase
MRLGIDKIAKACKGRVVNETDNWVSGISTDSRTLKPGDAFFALSGPNFDGHLYINEAFNKGAVCAIVSNEAISGYPLIIAEDTSRALLDLAACYRRLYAHVKVVAVTGSAGKTTTKDMIASVLSQKYKIKKTEGNYNNHIGVPLTLFQLEEGDEAIVVEMGMNHAGEIHKLSMAATPDIAVITNIGDAHIENFENREGILQAKLEITDGLHENGLLIVNGDDALLNNKYNFKTIYCHMRDTVIEPLGMAGSRFTLGDRLAHLKLPGGHMVMNALLAAAVGEALGLDPAQIVKGIENFNPSDNRMEFITVHGMQIINDSYNANPSAMKAAIQSMEGIKTRRVCVLGDMFELGGHAEALHREVGRFTAEQGAILVAVGNLARYMADGYMELKRDGLFYFPDKNSFLAVWPDILRPGDTVLVKASNGMGFTEIIEALKNKNALLLM